VALGQVMRNLMLDSANTIKMPFSAISYSSRSAGSFSYMLHTTVHNAGNRLNCFAMSICLYHKTNIPVDTDIYKNLSKGLLRMETRDYNYGH
jgi:hypothetical protein